MPDEVAATLDWKILIGPGRFFCTSIRSSRKPRFAPASVRSEKASITETQRESLERHGDKETGRTESCKRRPEKNMKKKLRPLLFVIAILLLMFQRSQAQEKKLDPFTISYASVSGTRGPLWIAQ